VEPVRLEEPASGFSAYVPSDFHLTHDAARGVYELRSDARAAAVEYTRVTSAAAPVETARSVVEQRGLTLVSQRADDERAVVTSQYPDGRRWTVDVRRDAPGTLAVTTYGRLPGAGPERAAEDAHVLEWVAASAAGGTAVSLPEERVERPVAPIPLKAFTTEDQSATGKVPAESGWATGGVNGAIEAAHPTRGELHLGIPATICLPGGQSAAMSQLSPPGWAIAPYMPADAAVVQVWPQLRNLLEPGIGFGGMRIEGGQPQNWGPPFSAGVFAIQFQKGAVPWRGAMLAATAPIPASDTWLFYYSEIAVPDSDDSSVAQALVDAWAAYDPSKAKDQRMAATRQSMAAVVDIIRSSTTLRQQTFEKSVADWSKQFRGS
jgi:hypothetical protein